MYQKRGVVTNNPVQTPGTSIQCYSKKSQDYGDVSAGAQQGRLTMS